jgi:flagellum-specific peptidoglycan hydrolase FlgJ
MNSYKPRNLMGAIADKPFYKERPKKIGLKATLVVSNLAWIAIALVMSSLVMAACKVGTIATAKYLEERKNTAAIQAETARLMAERDLQIARMASFQSAKPEEIIALAGTIRQILNTADNGRQLKFLEKAVPEALRIQVEAGIPASACIAQAIYESGYGSSELAKESNNFFGIKAFANWGGERVNMPTKDSGVSTTAHFRVYADAKEGFNGYAQFLKSSSRYDRAFQAGNGEQFVAEVLRAGYCPDPDYLDRIREIMRRHKLAVLDSYYKQLTAKAAPTRLDDPS